MDPEPFLNDLGEQVGWVIPADDGQTYLCEFDGSVAAIWDDHEQDWDVDIEPGYTFADEDPYEQRIAELEQRVNEPRPVSEITVARAVEETDMERVNEDMMRQSEQAERMIDRRFTLRERRLIGAEMLNEVEAGRQPDISGVIERLELRGEDLPDLDHENPHQAREARVRTWSSACRTTSASRPRPTTATTCSTTSHQPRPTSTTSTTAASASSGWSTRCAA
jgi:hypothetical protein